MQAFGGSHLHDVQWELSLRLEERKQNKSAFDHIFNKEPFPNQIKELSTELLWRSDALIVTWALMCAGFPNAHFSLDDLRDDQPVMLFIQNSFYAFVKKNMMPSWYYLSTLLATYLFTILDGYFHTPRSYKTNADIHTFTHNWIE